jgi:hypothetical protein
VEEEGRKIKREEDKDGKVISVLNQSTLYEDTLESEGIAQCILILATRWK